MAAPALGPPAGGWLVTHATWRWIFLANLPIGAVALVLGLRLLRDIGYREARPLDWRGWTMGSVSMIGLVMVSRQAGEWGWGSAATIGTASGSFLVLAWLVVRSLRSADPIIDFRMFAAPGFSLTFVLMGLNTVTMFARVVFLPVELQVVRGMSALDVGLLLAPAALGVAVTMPIGGWLADRVGARAPVTIGVAFTLVATWMLAGLEPSTSETEIVVALLVAGVGTGFALTPLNVSALNALPARLVSQGTAVRAMGNQLASALGTAAFAALVVARLGAVAPYGMGPGDLADGQAAYNGVFAVSLVIMAGTLGLALFLPGRAATREHQAARVAEHEALVAAAGRE
ncbi:MAG: MFS transporter [Acidimicrobiia bacterium]|nr:MFS transporter [Acidimicrobiia bacterium]